MRAAAAGLCEPALLQREDHALRVVQALERITTRLASWPERGNEEYRVLRQALGYCWSVALVASPPEGKACLARWATSRDRDVRWVVRENLKKKRLQRLDGAWVEEVAGMLESSTSF